MSGGGGTNTTVQQADPWSGQQPYLQQIYANAMGNLAGGGGFGNYGFGGVPSGYWDDASQRWIPGGGTTGGGTTGGIQPREFFPGQTYVDQSPETLQALDLQAQRALGGSPLNTAGNEMLSGTLGGGYLNAQPGAGRLTPLTTQAGYANAPGGQELLDTAAGDYLYGNPGFNRAFEAARNQITPAVQGAFESRGRFGGGLAQEAETGALGDAFAGLYGQERGRQLGAAGQLSGLNAAARSQLSSQRSDTYGDERQRMLAGLGFLPQQSALEYGDIGQLAGVGAAREGFEGLNLQDQMRRWDFGQNEPYNRLGFQSSIIQGGFPGGTTTTETPYHSNTGAGLLGGALTGGALAGMIPGSGGAGAAGAGAAAGAANPYLWPLIIGGGILGSGIL